MMEIPYAYANDDGSRVCPVCETVCRAPKGARTEDTITKGAGRAYAEHYQSAHQCQGTPLDATSCTRVAVGTLTYADLHQGERTYRMCERCATDTLRIIERAPKTTGSVLRGAWAPDQKGGQ